MQKRIYKSHWPSPKEISPQHSLVIFDQALAKYPSFRNWKSKYPVSYGVSSGEKLKNLEMFSGHLQKILQLANQLEKRPIQIVAVGGGSVGDFAGFVASVFKRGVGLVHIPSTWLAAIDSSHGGKTGMNVGGIKNQVGTFYPAGEIFLIKELLQTQPQKRAEEALGEALKIALIDSQGLWTRINHQENISNSMLWKSLPSLVDAKYRVVRKDPFEQKGIRHVLNLGHTVGHVLESKLKIPHGTAVLAGLGFSLQWSVQKGLLSQAHCEEILKSRQGKKIPTGRDLSLLLRKLSSKNKLRDLLLQDKKRKDGQEIRFVFVCRPGKTIIRSMPVREIEAEILRQSR